MTVQTHQQTANFIWSICNLLRGPYKCVFRSIRHPIPVQTGPLIRSEATLLFQVY
jgi:hypothetical protein